MVLANLRTGGVGPAFVELKGVDVARRGDGAGQGVGETGRSGPGFEDRGTRA